jgi:predicted membrane channel-forming protein YqfA (hemolysin III family)
VKFSQGHISVALTVLAALLTVVFFYTALQVPAIIVLILLLVISIVAFLLSLSALQKTSELKIVLYVCMGVCVLTTLKALWYIFAVLIPALS